MYEYYQSRIPEKVLKQSRKDIRNIYDDIPETDGCMENLPTCQAWCCLSPEVRVYTPNGMIPICLLKVGDIVYTKGGLRKITRVGNRKTNKRIVEVQTCYGRKMRLTEDHLVLCDLFARKGREKTHEPQWVPAGELIPKRTNKSGHFIVFPKLIPKQNIDVLDTAMARLGMDQIPGKCIKVDAIIQNVFITDGLVFASSQERGNPIPQMIEATPQFFWILGLYLAEGTIGDNSVDFHINAKESDLRSHIEAFAASFGVNCTHKINRGDSLTVRVFSTVLSRLFLALGSNICDKKSIHQDVLTLALFIREIRQAILSGYYAGDGCKALSDKQCFSATTTSQELMYQLSMLLLQEKRFPSICFFQPEDKRPYWITTISDGKYRDYVETKCDFRVPVKSVEFIEHDGLVYDIEVEYEHSFFTECGEVHNCEHQNPSVFYSEFLNTYWYINHKWSKAQLKDLFIRAVRTYISSAPTKGCVFWDKDSKQCTQHETRPFNCRTYGQVPEDDFKPRFDKLKILYADQPGAIIRDQCSLVKSRKQPTSEQMNEWFKQLGIVEEDVGIPPRLHGDMNGGSYRTYHDHLLLQMAPPSLLDRLTRMRLNATDEQKEAYVKKLEGELEEEIHGTTKSDSS